MQAASCEVLDGVSHDAAIKTSSEAAGVSRLTRGRTYDQVHSLEPLPRTASPPGSWLPPGRVIPESKRAPKMEATVFSKTQYQSNFRYFYPILVLRSEVVNPAHAQILGDYTRMANVRRRERLGQLRGPAMGSPGGSMVENLPVNAGDLGLIPGLRRCPGEGNGNPLQYS